MNKTYLTLTILLSFFLLLNYNPPSSLNFFGVYLGNVSIFNVNLEHEWFGIGLLIGAIIFYPTSKFRVYVILFSIFLILSDFYSILLFKNILGSFTSLILGLIYSYLIYKSLSE